MLKEWSAGTSMENKEDIPVELNSPQGVLWKQTLMQAKQKIEIGKIDAELNEVVRDYCEKKVKEDQEKIEKELKGK